MTQLISIEGVTYRYPDLAATTRDTLHDIQLTIAEGEYIAVLGANGSGKSTLARMINGLLLPDSGNVLIKDKYNTRNPSDLSEIRKTVGMVFQFPDEQIFSSTIEEDVAFGLENFAWEYEAMHARVREVLQHLNLWEIRQRPSYLLSAGQTQRLALAGVLAIRPRCVIFDEATSMLDPLGREMVLRQMQQLQQDGSTVIHITHSMEEASQASRVVVLMEGTVRFDGKPAELFSGDYDLEEWRLEFPPVLQIIHDFRAAGLNIPAKVSSLDDLSNWLKDQPVTHPSIAQPGNLGPLEIEVHQLGHIYLEGTPYQTRAIRATDLSVEKGGGHGLIGVTGSGKSTLLQHLNGLLRPQMGSVRVGSFNTGDPKLTLQQLVQYAGLVMQNPEVQFFEEFVGDEVAYGPRTLKVDEPLARRVRWAMEQVGLDFDAFKDRRIHGLSGGEKRKAALASVLALKPQVLLLDEPTAGLDPATHRDILAVFKRMMSEGVTIVASAHNMDDIAALSRRVTVMVDGQSSAEGWTETILGDVGKMAELKMAAPITARLTAMLRQAGLPLEPVFVRSADLIAAFTAGERS